MTSTDELESWRGRGARWLVLALAGLCLLFLSSAWGPAFAQHEGGAEAADLGVYLADTQPRAGWVPVALPSSGTLYLQSEPLIRRSDLMGIRAIPGTGQEGKLVLILTDQGLAHARAGTAAHPGLRLALLVGQTLLAAPRYASPIAEQQLAFSVGTLADAENAARAVAGVDEKIR